MVCIIDDREDVWKMAPNLVHVRPYRFFDGTADINAPPEASKTTADMDDKSTEGGVNVKTLRRNVHVVRVPKKPRNGQTEAGKQPAAESTSVDSSDKNPSKSSGTPVTSSSAPDASATASESSSASDCNDRRTDANAAPSSSDLEVTAETSASRNSDADLPVSTKTTDNDTNATCHSDAEQRSQTAADKDTATDSDAPSAKPVDAVAQNSAPNDDDEEYEELVEWEDLDDYLVYLEDILQRIHTAYYELYDQMHLTDDAGGKSDSDAPDLKTIVPYVRRKVLKGARVIFSGVCPLGTDLTACRIYRVAESLGAVVQSSVVTDGDAATTHVVAARPGTEKVKAASRQKSVWIVNPDWVWTCADRWEWVDERLYPLNDETSARFLSRDSPDPTAKPPRKKNAAHNGRKTEQTTSEGVDNNGMSGGYSLVTLSKEVISGMDAEVDKILDEDSDSENEDDAAEAGNSVMKENQLCSAEDGEDEAVFRKQVLSSYCGNKRKYEESSDEESLSGDFPKGWKDLLRKRRKCSGVGSRLAEAAQNEVDEEDGDGDGARSDDSRSGNLSSSASRDEEDFNDSVGSADDEIAAAVEKEFLS